MKLLALALVAALLIAGCVGQTQTPTGAAVAEKPQEPAKTAPAEQETITPPVEGQASAECREVTDPVTGEFSLDCG